MDGFDSKDFYGYSLSADPKLRTTTRNYEFKYNSSDHLERIISRVQMDREKKKQKQLFAKNRFVPNIEKIHGRSSSDVIASEIFKSQNFKTQMNSSCSRETVVKVMSDAEIEAMISQALLCEHCIPKLVAEEYETSVSVKKIPKALSSGPRNNDKPIERVEIKATNSAVLEVLPAQKPQWVEIKPTQKACSSVYDLDSTSLTERTLESREISMINLANENLETDETMRGEKSDHRLYNVISFDSKLSDDFLLRHEDSSYQDEAESPPPSPLSLSIESPLNNYERAEMERVLGKMLPQITEMDFGNISESSEYIEDPDDDDVEDASSSENIEQHVQPTVRIQHLERNPEEKPSQTSTESPRPTNLGNTKLVSFSPRSCSVQKTPSKERPAQTPLDKRMKKQIEALKQEKIRIFSKMTSIQEKTIDILEKLRISLLELSLPDGHAQRKLRERNAFEFSVRFSRNFIFPLGRMIEELRISPREEFHSATTNEPCVKVCGIYGLLSQAIQCYHKQLRHFFTDSVPKKLDVLLNMVIDTTNICLQKKIFDKRDTLIQCLMLRAGAFLDFVTELIDQKRKNDREQDDFKSGRRDHLKLSKTSSKWDLTMNLNNLNMYEPKLVAKKPKKKPPKKPINALSSRITFRSKEFTKPAKDNDCVAQPAQDPVDTQVQKFPTGGSLQLINSAIEQNSELSKNLIETLQDITKDEVRQMLGPIVSNLDTILKNPDNPQTVESVLGVLNSQLLAKCKQLKIDEAATENSTQNGNTNQKEVTKKGADSSKGDRRKENRKIRVSNTKTTATTTTTTTNQSNNVKEGSTEPTERHNSCDGRTDTVCDKQSLNNTDLVEENDSPKQTAHSRSDVGDGAVLSAATAKKLISVPAAIQIGGIQPQSLGVSRVEVNELFQQSPPSSAQCRRMTPSRKMTSQCLEYSTSMPGLVPVADKFAPEMYRIGDGRYREEIVSQWKVSDGTANALGKAEANQEALQKSQQSRSTSTPAFAEATKSSQIKLNYYSNALYTFVKYCEDDIPSPDAQSLTDENDIAEQCFTESCTRLTMFSAKPSQDASFKSILDSNTNLLAAEQTAQQLDEETKNEEDIKALLEERSNFVEQCKDDPLYTNPQFPQPWKVLSKISQTIAHEIVGNFENEMSFGEETYVRDFINMEMQT